MDLSPQTPYEQRELKSKYLKLSKLYHPDKNPSEDAATQFIKVKLAYDILGDNQKKLAYDLFYQTDFTNEEKTLQYVRDHYKDEE